MPGAPKIAFITIFDEAFRDIADRTVPTMRRYADTFDLQFFALSPEAQGRPPAWGKILRIREILQSDFDYCLYVDADTMVVRFDQDIRGQIDTGRDLYLCWHGPANTEIYAPLPGHFNCGVMAWRKSAWSLEFLDEIWRQTEFIDHGWWEQAALNRLLGYRSALDPELADSPDPGRCAHVGRLPVDWNVNVGFTVAPDPVIVHFAGSPRSVRLAAIDREIAAQPMRNVLPPGERHQLSRYMNLMIHQDDQLQRSAANLPIAGRAKSHAGSPAAFLADRLLALRHRMAPPRSQRERVLRAIYVPWITRLAQRQQQRAFGAIPEARVKLWQSPGTRAAALPPNPRILVLKLDLLGDFVVALCAFEQLREAFPDATITLVCGPWNQAWGEQCGLFDTVVVFDFFMPAGGNRRHPGQAQFDAFRAMPLGSYDLAIDLRHDSDTRQLLTLVDAGFRAGFCAPLDAGGDCLDIAVPDPELVSIEWDTGRPLHAETRLLLLATAVVATFRPHPHPAGRLVRSTGADKIVPRPYAIIAPGAGTPIKLWPADRFVTVARALQARHGLHIVITGGTREREVARSIGSSLPAGRVSNLAGCLTLSELPTVISQADLYVGLDTGATHLAAALDIPTIAIISGVPNLDVWHTKGRQATVVVGRVPCSPCNLTRPEQCPYGVVCLGAITPDHVIDACDAALQRRPSQALAESAG